MATDEAEATRQLTALSRAGLIDHVRGSRYRLHDVVRAFARARLADEEEPADRTAAQERLIANYAELADSVLRLVDGNMSTRSNQFGQYGFTSLDEALRWLDDESSFITATLRHAEGVDQGAVLNLLGALCDYCLLRGDLYRLGEISELAQSVDQGLLAALGAVAHRYRGPAAGRAGQGAHDAGLRGRPVPGRPSRRRGGAGPVLAGDHAAPPGQPDRRGGQLPGALDLQAAPELATDRAWTLHALAAVQRDRARLAEALELLTESLVLHRAGESVHGQAWAHFQLGQLHLRMGDVPRAESDLRVALDLYGRTQDARGEAWALTQLARARLVAAPLLDYVDGPAAVEGRRRSADPVTRTQSSDVARPGVQHLQPRPGYWTEIGRPGPVPGRAPATLAHHALRGCGTMHGTGLRTRTLRVATAAPRTRRDPHTQGRRRRARCPPPSP
ncbi:hypothetical protein STENM327S_02695 [Streptomyces tendae]